MQLAQVEEAEAAVVPVVLVDKVKEIQINKGFVPVVQVQMLHLHKLLETLH